MCYIVLEGSSSDGHGLSSTASARAGISLCPNSVLAQRCILRSNTSYYNVIMNHGELER